jgi:hypothetical protein
MEVTEQKKGHDFIVPLFRDALAPPQACLRQASTCEQGGECGAKRKRAKPQSSRRFTRESLYQNTNALQALFSG